MILRFKSDIITWLYIFLIFPVGIIVSTTFFYLLAIVLSGIQPFPTMVYLVEALILGFFILAYIALFVFYRKELVIYNETKITDTNKYSTSIDANRITKMVFIKTQIYLLPLLYLTNGNVLSIHYFDKDGVECVYRTRLFSHDIRKFLKTYTILIEYRKSKFN